MVKWGILGTSFISETMAQAINNDHGSTIQAIAGRRKLATDAFAQNYAVPTKYTDYDELISDPEVDIVYIGLPNHLHHRFIQSAASAGKHILSEKSLSIDMEKTHQILEAVIGYDKLVIEGLMYLHHPFTQKLIELLNSKVIGNIRTISGQYCADIAKFVNPDGGGAIYNLGCYPISLLHLVIQNRFGDGIWADAGLKAIGKESKLDGNICEASLLIDFPNGVSATIHTAETFGMYSNFVIVGDEGSLQFETNPWLPERSNLLMLTKFSGEKEQFPVNATGNAFDFQVTAIRNAIEQGKKQIARPAPSIQDSFEIMKILTQWEELCFSHLASTKTE